MDRTKRKIILKFYLALTLIIGISFLPQTLMAQVTEEWVARYNGPGNDYDSASDIAVDQSGNVYVTGASAGFFYDYATIKYDANGNQLWVSRYNGPGNGHDVAVALRVDAVGNVYVTGYSPGSGTSNDYATIKYDTNGNQQWVSRYNGPGNGNDNANALAIDAAGNVYVSGASYGTSNDYATIKYDTNGNQQWASRYNGPGNGNDNANALAIDAAGNVYVSGSSYGTSNDYATIKYDTNGNQLWVSRYNGPGNYADSAGAIAIDVTGNVYVTGASDWDYSSNLANYATIKYDPGGNQLWVAIYDGPANDTDAANNISVDSSGNVYVTGYSYGVVTSMDYATVKYDTNGNQLWVARYDGPSSYLDGASGLALDADSNVYVTGYVYGPGPTDYATVKYDTNGNQLWAVHYNSPACCGDDYATAIVLDTQNNVYVTGTSFAPTTLYGYYDYATIKYSQPPPAELPRTGQTTCYDSAGAVIACAGTGQDGEIQAGIPWPNPRFTDNGNATVTDALTGLMWTKDGNAPGPVACSPASTKAWQAALNYVACLNANSYLGYTDWRLPNVNELKSMVHNGQSNTATWLNTQGFNNVQFNLYWSSTSHAYYPNYAWYVDMSYGYYGYVSYGIKSNGYYVWPVRFVQGGLIQLPKTGQTTCYDSVGTVISCVGTGQDGEIQAGVPWPNPRFTDNGNATVTDNLTSLMWTKDGNAPGPGACSPATTKTWQDALNYVACLNTNSYLGYTDWRLPNVNELRSMVHDGQSESSTWLNSQGFNNVQSNGYWPSTSGASSPGGAWLVAMWNGNMSFYPKSLFFYVWPVRSGQVGASPCVPNTYYRDADGDTYGTASVTTQACTQPSGYVSNSSDCNDSNASIHPGATEVCNGVDDNCNGQIDEGVQNTYYRDVDNDTYGNASVTTQTCTVPSGYVSDNTDCNDASASINPAAMEICNGVDDNCNGQIDDACLIMNDLSISHTDSPDPVTPAGQNVTYTITVTNNGPSPATGVTVTEVLDASLTLVSAIPSQGDPCTGTGTITCNLGNMISGSSATVTVVATTSTTPGMIGSTASVTATEPDPNASNNSAMQATNVGDVSREVGISTRGYVETGTSIMVGGFSFGGTVSKKVLIRGRGPSMSGAPYNFTGTLTNPTLEIYSGPTLFATIDDWQTGATMCNAPAESCGTPSELQAALVDPCQPNAGQTTAPPGCMQEAALYITLPPGAYTVKLMGVNNEMGKGIIEVYDADTASLTMLGGMSTRGKVLTGTDVLVGGFIVGAGSTNKTLLLRGRGPSMSGAPYNFTGTLSNPTLEVYSGQTLFATVDDWQSGSTMCNAPAISCGTPSQLRLALVDPCQPNVGQTTAPPGCTQESAMFITLPPGAYTAKLKGVNNDIGIGIFEVYEMP